MRASFSTPPLHHLAPVRTADATATEPPSSVAKACRILRAIGALAQPRLTDIAQATELDKATVLRLLDALARGGRIQRDVSGS